MSKKKSTKKPRTLGPDQKTFLNFFDKGWGVYTMLDEWLEKIKACEPLPENDLRQLCEMVRSSTARQQGCCLASYA
jgi:hypothetical protein